ncbi:MAG TPA: hypothetical protein VEK06_00355, partial [Myxococcota bacterium]|nr:hypothetical protein [Myxococcota bacterium]
MVHAYERLFALAGSLMIKEQIKKSLKQSVSALVAQGQLSEHALSLVEKESTARAKNPLFGDFAANVAMLIAREEKKPPLEVAQLIADELKNTANIFEKIEVAPPGFINLKLNEK